MNVLVDNLFNISFDEGMQVNLTEKNAKAEGIESYTFELLWNDENAEKDSEFIFSWFVPMIETMYRWNTALKNDRHLPVNYGAYTDSMISVNAPIDAFFDGNGNNKYTWALDETVQLIKFRSGADESHGMLNCIFKIGVKQFTNKNNTKITLRIDRRKIPLYKTLEEFAIWWEEECGLKSLSVPEIAKLPLYSFWYSYHGGISAEIIEAECKRAKEIGFDVCIVDDGWQIDPGRGGYVNCGDWVPSKIKMGDMAEHIKRVQAMGMKYILWFTVPYLGYEANVFERFKDMILWRPDLATVNDVNYAPAVFDPRYKEVREYLINIFVNALRNWNLDGFKLDFIDRWCDHADNAPYNEKMDIPALQDAVSIFMSELTKKLTAIKPDIAIEFRQFYTGPSMRQYGNMFRVNDCPNDHISNRVGVLDLRMLMRNSAVHSDMLMWHDDEKPEIAALQIIGIMYGVMQYSSKLNGLTDDMRKMSLFWLNFLKNHHELLLETPLEFHDIELLYTWIKATKDNKSIVTVYAPDKCVKCDAVSQIYLVNGTMSSRIIFELDGTYNIEILNCFGEYIGKSNMVSFNGINEIKVPVAGICILKKAED